MPRKHLLHREVPRQRVLSGVLAFSATIKDMKALLHNA